MKTWRGAGESETRVERLRLRPWTDPRLLLGVLLVLGATVLGARVYAAADDTVGHWSLAADVRAGDPVTEADLVATQVRLDDAGGERYLRVDDELPASLDAVQWATDLSAGALVDRDMLVPRSTAEALQVPVPVAAMAMPADLRSGDRIQVWVGSGPGEPDGEPAELVLDGVRVVDPGRGDDGALEGGERSVLLEVAPDRLTGEVVDAIATGHVTVVRLP